MGAKGDLGTSGSKGKSNTFSFSLSASRFLMVFPDVSKFLMEQKVGGNVDLCLGQRSTLDTQTFSSFGPQVDTMDFFCSNTSKNLKMLTITRTVFNFFKYSVQSEKCKIMQDLYKLKTHLHKITKHYVVFKKTYISSIYFKHTRIATYEREEKRNGDQDERRGNSKRKQENIPAWAMVLMQHQLRNITESPNIKFYTLNSCSF